MFAMPPVSKIPRSRQGKIIARALEKAHMNTTRDGACTSLWQDTNGTFAPAAGERSQLYDVAIAGAGITGITLALCLQEAGLRCVVIEARNIGFGTTGGTTAHLNTILETSYRDMIRDFGRDNALLVARGTEDAVALFKENVRRFSIDCGFREVPGYLFAQDKAQENLLDEVVQGCMDVGLLAGYTNDIPIPVSFTKAMRIPGQGQLHPLRYTEALARVFESRGGVILGNHRVMDFHSAGGQVSVETSGVTLNAGSLVFATHVPIGVNVLHFRCPAYRSYAMAATLEGGIYPEGVVYDLYDPYHYYRTQEIDGKKYLIVGGCDHKTGDEMSANTSFLELESHVRANFPVAKVTHKWSAQYFDSVDGLPYIGRLPGSAGNIFAATGYGGNGITYSHIAAKVIRDLILQIDNPMAGVFDPRRVKPVAAFTEFVKHNADVVKTFVGKWLSPDELKEFASLAPGEGKVVKYGPETIAVHKDQHGKLYAVNPACTHVKCAVAWNNAEQSWDCPCHGSRFSADGEVLTAPATRALEPIEVRTLEYQRELNS